MEAVKASLADDPNSARRRRGLVWRSRRKHVLLRSSPEAAVEFSTPIIENVQCPL